MNVKVGVTALVLFAAGCSSSETTTEDATTTVAEAIGEAQDADVPMGGRELLGKIPVNARRWEHEGIQCDTTPESTTVEVCGQSYPADLHLAWTDCQVRFRGRGGRGWHRGPPGTKPEEGSATAPAAPVSSGAVDVVTTI